MVKNDANEEAKKQISYNNEEYLYLNKHDEKNLDIPSYNLK